VAGSSITDTGATGGYFRGGQAISPAGWAFIVSSVTTGVLLVLAGATVIAFANALHPLAGEPVTTTAHWSPPSARQTER
jgi:hypothetical protein